MDEKLLIRQAMQARKMSYSPYSNFMVGAALLTAEGKVYTGCNIENAAYSPTNCAERTAFFTAVANGERNFKAIAIVGFANEEKGGEPGFAHPCGVCRQVMMEFCNSEDFKIIVASGEDNYSTYTLKQLLPFGFGPDNL